MKDKRQERYPCRFLLCTENPQLGWGFRKAFSFKPVIKTPFDLLKHLA
ncbi:MFS transporter, partial [Escherichia coli]